jgi:hypothetical protein
MTEKLGLNYRASSQARTSSIENGRVRAPAFRVVRVNRETYRVRNAEEKTRDAFSDHDNPSATLNLGVGSVWLCGLAVAIQLRKGRVVRDTGAIRKSCARFYFERHR